MIQFELLPRLIPDSHFDRARDAVAEAERRVADPVSADALTRITEGRYGGFQVFTVSRTLAIDFLLGQVENGIVDPGMVPRAFRT